MSSILKVDTIQDQSGNNIINESGNVITIGASGDTITVPAGATVSGFTSAGIDDNATSTAITISSGEDVTFTENILLGDNKKAKFGTGNDLEIYHTGTQSVISDVGSGNLNLEGDAKIVLRSSGGSENYAQFFKDGAVELYYDNAKKFETTSAGATVTGTTSTSGGFFNTVNNSLLTFGGGNAGNVGSNLTMYGGADSSTGDFRFRNSTTINAFITAAGQIQGVSLAPSTPTFSFTSDTNTGMTRPTGDTLTLVTGGNERLRITSAGKVAIGKTTVDSEIANLMLFGSSPGTASAGQLGIQGSETTGAANTGAGIAFKGHNGSGNRNFGDLKCQKENSSSGDNLSYMSFATRDSSGVAERLRIASSGSVGIGTSSPVSVVNIEATKTTALSSANDFLTLGLTVDDNTAYNEGVGGGIAFRGKRQSGGQQTIWGAIVGTKRDNSNDGYNGNLRFFTNNNSTGIPTEHLRITSEGLVGIGETTPLTKLHVKTADSGVTPFANADEMLVEGSTHSGITIGSGTSGTGNIYFGDSADNDVGRITYDHSADRLDFRTNTQSGFFMQTMTGVTITSSYANMLTVPFGGYLIEIGSSANNASREVWLVLRNGAAYSAATTRLLQRTGNDGPRTYNIRVPADGILEAKLDSGSTITDAKISLFKFGM